MDEISPEDEVGVQVLELDSGTIVAFVGTRGFDGVYRLSSANQWAFRPPGSPEWDAFHQAAYRNTRATLLTFDDLKERGIPPLPAAKERHGKVRKERAEDEMPLRNVPRSVRRKLRAFPKGQWQSLFLLLKEDEYETLMGDGKFRYLHAACWEKGSAQSLLAELEEEDRQRRSEREGTTGMLYTLKEVRLLVDGDKNSLLARLRVERYDRFNLADVVDHLKRR